MSEEAEELSLQEEVEAAFKDSNAKEDDVSNEEVIDKLEKPRDEDGKFAKKDKEEEVIEPANVEEEQEEPAESQVTLSNEKAPSSWSPSVREKWGKLDPDVRAEIIRREEASVNGVRKLQEEHAPIRQFAENLSPFINEAIQGGVNPAQYIGNVMATERRLRSPDLEQKFTALIEIADQYGIPLRDIINQSVGKEVLTKATPQTAAIPPQIQQELEESRRFRQQQQERALQQEIESFSKDKEFFEDVKSIMADFMDSGRAKSLADAYEQACWVHPDVRKVMLERDTSEKKKGDLKQRQTAASGAKVKASGTADVTVDDDGDDSIEATVRKAMIEAAGRV